MDSGTYESIWNMQIPILIANDYQEILIFFYLFSETNACMNNNGGCQHLCFMLPGQTVPKCKCAAGVLDKDGKTCKGKRKNPSLTYQIFCLNAGFIFDS